MLAALTNLNILFLGSPGVAKSFLVNRLTQHLEGGKIFDTLLTSFSTPEEIFGPFSMNKIKEDKYERVVEGMLPTADLAFLDETFKANSSILNSLLTVMNERKYRNGVGYLDIPLISLVGASNETPSEEDGLEAMFDRFHLKYVTNSIQEPGNFMTMIEMPHEPPPPETTFTRKDLAEARIEVDKIEMPKGVVQKLAKLREELNNSGFFVTDRTYKVSLKVLKAEAWLKGRDHVEDDDLDILRHMFWTSPDKARAVYLKILELVNPEKNVILDKYEEVMHLTKEVFAEQDGAKAMEKGIEYAQKFKVAKKEITKLMNSMITKNKNVDEIQQMLRDIDTQIVKIFVEVLNFDKDLYNNTGEK